MSSPYALKVTNDCMDWTPASREFLCNLSPAVRRAFEDLSRPTAYPQGAFLFSQEEEPRGIFVVCKGRVKISMTSADGRTVILRIAKPGEVVGLYAVVSGEPYQANAETVDSSQVLFVKRQDFLRFLLEQPEALLETAKQLGREYRIACEQVRALSLTHSAPKKLATFLLNWTSGGQAVQKQLRARLTLTHEEIGQMIGTSRETVTRTFTDFRNQQLVMLKGSELVIRNREALAHFAEI